MSTDQDIITFDRVISGLNAGQKKQVIEQLAEMVAEDRGINKTRLAARLLNRENEQGSGIGNGVAIMHAPFKELESPYMLFTRLPHKIEFDGPDDQPADLLCLILSPESDGPYHLRRLARISRIMRDKTLCESLRGATSQDTLEALLLEPAALSLAA